MSGQRAKNHREEERICRLVAGLFEEGEEGEVEQDCDEAKHSLQTGLPSPATKQNQDRPEIFPSLCSTVYT